jgi:hypothetical protein
MKVIPEHQAVLYRIITVLDTPERRDDYRNGRFDRADRVKDLDKRYRWDLFWQAWRTNHNVSLHLQGYNDAHIDTALRSMVPTLEV